MNVFAIGASKNIGYYAASRLLAKGATITFLLRSPGTFDNDATMSRYAEAGFARFVQGDALKKGDVARGWAKALEAGNIDLVLFTLGHPNPKLTLRGIVIDPPNLCTQATLNLLCTMPTELRTNASFQPRLITITSTGVTKSSHEHLPLAMQLLYSWLLPIPHEDKLGVERVLLHCSGREWDDREPSTNILQPGWQQMQDLPAKGQLKRLLIVRPAFLTNGPCKGDEQPAKGLKRPYRFDEEDMDNNGYTISRHDIAHFIVEEALQDWERWEGKRASVAY